MPRPRRVVLTARSGWTNRAKARALGPRSPYQQAPPSESMEVPRGQNMAAPRGSTRKGSSARKATKRKLQPHEMSDAVLKNKIHTYASLVEHAYAIGDFKRLKKMANRSHPFILELEKRGVSISLFKGLLDDPELWAEQQSPDSH